MLQEMQPVLTNLVDSVPLRDRTGVSVLYLSEHLGLDEENLQRAIERLEHAGYVKTRQFGRTSLIAPTMLGRAMVAAWRKGKRTGSRSSAQPSSGVWTKGLQVWVAVATICGTVIALVALLLSFPDFLREWSLEHQNPMRLLTIEDTSFVFPGSQSRGTVLGVLSEQVDPASVDTSLYDWQDLVTEYCPESNEGCREELYPLYSGSVGELNLTVSSRGPDPLIVNGLVVTLEGYRHVDSPLNVLYTDLVLGGGSGWSVYSLHRFPLIPNAESRELPRALQEPDPSRSVGTAVTATLDCKYDVLCQDILYLAPQEVHGLTLRVPFVRDLPPGVYEFAVALLYSYRGEQYISAASEHFIIVKPDVVRPWYLDWNFTDLPLRQSFVDLDYDRGKLVAGSSPRQAPPLSNPPGQLVFRTTVGTESTYFSYDLQVGSIRSIGDIGLLHNVMNTPLEYAGGPPQQSPMRLKLGSPDGWKRALELGFDTPEQNVDIVLLDLEREMVINITPTTGARELQPAWSSSGDFLAYVTYALRDLDSLRAGQAEIYSYDTRTGKSHQVTHTPTVVESMPVWIGENEIAFLMPEFSGHDIQNSQFGIGVVNVDTGETRLVSSLPPSENSTLHYLQSSQVLLLDNRKMFSLDGAVLGDLPDREGYACRPLDTAPIQQLCSGADTIGLFDSSTGTFITLADVGFSEKYGATKIVGAAVPDGFILADLARGQLHQYSLDGNVVGEWAVPDMSRFLSWGFSELILIPTESP